MNRRTVLCTLLVTLLMAGLGRAEPTWKAGVARVCITPKQYMWMSGYAARTHPATGKLHDLWAKALAVEDPGGHRVVLVTMDLVGIPREVSTAVCDELKRRHQLPREAVLLSVSHTHSGPVLRQNLMTMYDLDETQRRYVNEYTDELKKNLVSVVGDALARLAPADLAWGTSRVGFAVNRRNNKEAEVPKLLAEGKVRGPFDHDVPVLAVRNVRGQLTAVVCGYACHATVLDGYQWSGDYPGNAQIELEKAHPGAVALFWAGCGADQNPIPRRQVSLSQKYGKELAEAVDAVLARKLTPVTGRLAATYTEIELPFDTLPTRDKLLKDTLSTNRYVAARARELLRQLEEKGSLRGTYPYPVQAWRLGDDLTMVALGGEVVVDYALRLKKELGPTNTWVAGYTNDVMAYIPSLRVLKEGGYEGGGAMVYYGLPTVWGPAVEELIVAAVHEQVAKVRGR